jgi:NAD(P)H dehydrogenase (quinone)
VSVKILVLYDSNTGNTGVMAGLVGEGAAEAGGELRLRHVDQASGDDLVWCDGLALGSPTNYGTVSWRMKKWWDDLPAELWSTVNGRTGCAFSSAGGWGGGTELTCLTLLTILMNYGFSVFGVTEYVAERFTLHYGAVAAGEPRSEGERQACRQLGRELVARLKE